jgi:hypothetical protein
MKLKSQEDILTKWELYTPQQKEVILAEFRKKLPDDYYCKITFFEYLKEKLGVAGDSKKGGFRAVTK